MKLFIMIFLFSLKVEASDCISKVTNLSLGMKLLGALTHQIYGEDGYKERDLKQPVSTAEICTSSQFKQDWLEVQKTRLKLVKVIKNDFKTKGKTSGEFLYDLDGVPDKKEITDAEICPILDKQIKDDDDRSCMLENASSYKKLSQTNFLEMSFEDACRSLVPQVRESFKNRDKCYEEGLKKDSVVKRDPPGDEIAPADDGAPEVSTQVLKPKTRDQVKSEQPAKVRTSSGASKQ